jgi:HEAT repeat protein
MQQESDYSLLLLDLNSIDPDVKLTALNTLEKLEDKSNYVKILNKLSKHKEQAVREKALTILKAMGPVEKQTTLHVNNKEEEPIIKAIIEDFDGLITETDYQYFKPYIMQSLSKPSQFVKSSDLKEHIHRLLNNQDPSVRIKTLLPLTYINLEYKYQVNVLVDLLRDKSKRVVVDTIKHLHYVDKKVQQRIIPIITDKLRDPDPEVQIALEQYLLKVDTEGFEPLLQLLKTEGVTIKLQKQLQTKLYENLKG